MNFILHEKIKPMLNIVFDFGWELILPHGVVSIMCIYS
jgi:hypothetical protein